LKIKLLREEKFRMLGRIFLRLLWFLIGIAIEELSLYLAETYGAPGFRLRLVAA